MAFNLNVNEFRKNIRMAYYKPETKFKLHTD